MKKRSWTDNELIEAFNSSNSIRQILNKIGLIEAGGNYKTIQMHMDRLGLDKSKLLGKGWSIGTVRASDRNKPIKDILIENSNYQSSKLRKRLIKENILDPVCSSCFLDKWMDKDIPLELDHINGVNTDNRIDNLRLLCPNCHAMTVTYSGKNIKRKPQ